jgi:hypothetical protein
MCLRIAVDRQGALQYHANPGAILGIKCEP